jgi:hypothetical protein
MSISLKTWGCCCCGVGAITPLWKNTTQVAVKGTPNVFSSNPCQRYDEGQYNADHAPANCGDIPDGTCEMCGGWLVNGDKNGLPAQKISSGYPDIQPPVSADATHTPIDHNNYALQPVEAAGSLVAGVTYQIVTVGTTDFTAIGAAANQIGKVFTATGAGSGSGTAQPVFDTTANAFGGFWVNAEKYWHGMFGFLSKDGCGSPDPTVAPDQTRYRSVDYDAYYIFSTNTGGSANFHLTGSNYVERLTGIKKTTTNIVGTSAGVQGFVRPYGNNYVNITGHGAGTVSDVDGSGNPVPPTETYTGGLVSSLDSLVGTSPACNNTPVVPYQGFGHDSGGFENPNCSIAGLIDWWNTTYSAYLDYTALPAISDQNNYSASAQCRFGVGLPMSQITVTWTRTNTVFSFNVHYKIYPGGTGLDGNDIFNQVDFYGTIGLSLPYTSADCLKDLYALMGAWSMSRFALHKPRTDESLALMPLCGCDEVPLAVSPMFAYQASMDDYSGSKTTDPEGRIPGDPGYVTTWPQMAWLDPNDYTWVKPDGSYGGGTENSTLSTPRRTGEIISHTQAGSERHFWFGSETWKRVISGSSGGACDDQPIWELDRNGEKSYDPLPATAMRWRDSYQAQRDIGSLPAGVHGLCCGTGDCADRMANYPQSFVRERDGHVVGAKYVRASQLWKAVNYGQPCGAQRYTIAQTTVCCLLSGDAGSGFTVKKTGNAIAPLDTGGLAVNDYIAADGFGIYKITGITDDGTADWDSDGNPYQRWTIAVGSKIDDLPTGYTIGDASIEQTGNYIGKLRWTAPMPSAFCGQQAVTPAFDSDSGVVTLNHSGAFKWYRKDVSTGNLPDLRVYDASMTLLATITGTSVTRASDDVVSFTHAAMPTAAFVAAANWADYDSTSRRTAMKLSWSFNARATNLATGSQPAWLGGSGAGTGTGIVGCTGQNVTQFTYATQKCPVWMGWVPFYNVGGAPAPVESFSNLGSLFAMPDDIQFDSSYGALWLGAVETTMPDPLWEAPFKPDCDLGEGETLAWIEDDGSGAENSDDGLGHYKKYYPHHRMVEAAGTVPAGKSLPADAPLFYDSSHVIAPPYFYMWLGGIGGGIPIASDAGDWSSVEQPWGFTLRACVIGNRFSSYYTEFTPCP